MQYVSIKKNIKNDGKNVFLVQALTLKNSQGTAKQIIPHPLGDSYLEFETLEEAIRAIELAGFKYILPDGTKPEITPTPDTKVKSYDEQVFNALIEGTRDMNSAVVSAAITALGEMRDLKLLDLFIEKMGEDNEIIRNAAISSILQFGPSAAKELLRVFHDENWVKRNSAVICISRLIDSESVNPEKLFAHLIEMTNDKNHIVKISAITALGKAYKLYSKESK